MGASKKEIEETTSLTIEDAVDNTVRNSPGGEFLKNVKIYIVERDEEGYFAVEGDVWGVKDNISYRGFKIGDKVQWSSFISTKTGVIVDLKNSEICIIKESESGDIVKIKYDKLSKI